MAGLITKILLADDHKIVRDGLRSLLGSQPGFEVVGEADNGRDAIRMIGELDPDVVVMDIGMRELNGIDATRQAVREYPEIKVIALSMHSDKRFVSEMLKAGASGYVLKDSAFDELTTAITTVINGQRYLSPDTANVVVEDYVRHLAGDVTEESAGSDVLSPREREVLQLLAEGNSTKEMAATLHLSVKTIETHRRQIMDKLRIYSVAGLVKYALKEGIVSLDE